MWRPPWERNPLVDYTAWATLALFLIFMPIYGASQGDLFTALIGPGFVLFYLSLCYLISGHWLWLFRRKDDERGLR